MKAKIAINGFGRIGRSVLKNILKNGNLDIVAINDLADTETLLHLFRYDSVYGNCEGDLKDGVLKIEGREISIFSEKNPENIPWGDLGVDIVLECTGLFTDYENAKKHLKAGAKKVIISAPSKDPDKIKSLILGVNEDKFDLARDDIIDMGSCTTNCLAPIVKAMNEKFQIQEGFMTTIHSYTTTQNLLDAPHKDLRRARAAALNMIPTTTGAAKALKRVIPEIEDKIGGIALRVPTPTVSIIDLTCYLNKSTTAEELNNVFRDYPHKNILAVEDSLLVSSDYIGSSFSAVVDSGMTEVKNNLARVFAWYDNEWGYASRLAELAEFIFNKNNQT